MKMLTLGFGGRRFDMELENDFASYVKEKWKTCGLTLEKDNGHAYMLKAYLQSLKQNYENEKRIEALLLEISAFRSK